jgi:glycosyltransferase involved in cell wall biosynthesis
MIFAKRESQSLRCAGITVRQFFLHSRTSPLDVIQEFFRFRREIREFRPQVVHAHYGTVTALFCGLATARPLVITFRGSDLNPDPTVSRLRSALSHFFSQMAALRASQIICVASGLKRRLWWRRDQVAVIAGGVDLELFHPRPKAEARAALGWPAAEKIVLFNAGKSPRIKRLDLAEAAVEKANLLGCPARMVVLTGDTESSEIPLYLNAADCLLITSDWEGSPYIVREALSCELPIVSVEVGDVAERVAGVNPSRIVSRDANALGAALAEVLSLNCRSNGRSAMQELSEEKVAERVRSLYERIVM